MKPHKFQALLEYVKTHLNKKRCRVILVAMACVVVFCTTYALILPAVTMTPELTCDLPEHEHTEDCYELELVCDNDDSDHEHDDSCYEEVLICGEEEHQHNEDCYIFPEDEENTDDADPEEPADAEEEPDEPDAPDWEADLPELTGDWAEDVVAVAESQRGNEDLSRYCDWYAESTDTDKDELDTSAPFVAFCLYYAEVDEEELPRGGNADEWFSTLEEQDLLRSDDIPAPGDLLFYTGEDDTLYVGIVTDVDESDEEITCTVLSSNADGAVGESEYLANDAAVQGFASLPENPDENGGSTEASDEPDQPSDNDEDETLPASDVSSSDLSPSVSDSLSLSALFSQNADDASNNLETASEASDPNTLGAVDLLEDTIEAKKYENCTLKYNKERNAFSNNDDYGNYIIKNHPLGIAGSFSIVGFESVTLTSHANGNILAKKLDAQGGNFGSKGVDYELTYVQNYEKPNSQSSADDHKDTQLLVVGSETKINVMDDGKNIAIQDTRISSPSTIIQDVDSVNSPFIDLDEVKAEITKIGEILAQQPDNGVVVDFDNENDRSLIIDGVGGAHYLNTSLDVITGCVDRELRVKIPESNECIGSMIINVDCEDYQGQTVELPKIKLYVNDIEISFAETKDAKYGAVVWNFINATGITFEVNLVHGAIIAPGANIITTGNVDGTIVGENLKIGGESHRTDFTGTLTPTNLAFHFKKQVDGQTPSIYQEFQFVLEEWSSNEWKSLETKSNIYDDILFTPIKYTSSSDVGTHWYRVRELTDEPEGYQYDSTQYYVKVDVSNVADGVLGDTKLTADYTYYSSTSENGDAVAPDGTKLKKVGDEPIDRVFHNTTDNGAHTLPSTGGPGEWTIPSIGILLMAGSLLIVTKQRLQRREGR